MDASVDVLMKRVTGVVRLKLFKGSALIASRRSPESLYHAGLASFGEEATYDHADAEGFIKLFGLPARVAAERDGGKVWKSDATEVAAEADETVAETGGTTTNEAATENAEVATETTESEGVKTPAV